MPHKLSKPLLFVLWIVLCCHAIAEENVPEWLSGKPDVLEHPAYAKLYEHVISAAQQQLKVSLVGNELARKRLVNAVNKAVEHWKVHCNLTYKANLRYLVIGGTTPLHYTFQLTREDIQKYLIH